MYRETHTDCSIPHISIVEVDCFRFESALRINPFYYDILVNAVIVFKYDPYKNYGFV